MKPFQHPDKDTYVWYDPFDEFDPLAILTPPENTPAQLGYVARRAQHILNGRSISELHAGLDTLIWMLNRAGSDIATFQRRESESDLPERFSYSNCPIKNHVDELGQPLRGYYDDTDFDRLCSCIDNYDLSDQPDFLGAKATDYFAILCLAFISDVLRLAVSMDKQDEYNFLASLKLFKIDEYFFGATQSICYAEHLIELEDAEKNAFTRRARKGAKARVANFSRLRIKCLEQFKETYEENNINALKSARNIYASLTAKQISIFDTDDEEQRIEQVARWIRTYKKK